MAKQFEISASELQTVVKLYLAQNPFHTPARVYARWKCGKLNLLQDYKVWDKEEFIKLFDELKLERENDS